MCRLSLHQNVGKTKGLIRLKKSSNELHGIEVHWRLLNIKIYIPVPVLAFKACKFQNKKEP